MGGAVLLLLHRKEPSFWDGAILVAPMCKVCSSSLFIYLFIYFEFFFIKKKNILIFYCSCVLIISVS